MLCALLATTKPKRVIYCSRTHNQLENVLNEFKSTIYSKTFSISFIASKESLASENCSCNKKFN